MTVVDRATELLGHRLHSVADSEYRDAQLEHFVRSLRGVLLGHRIGAPG